MERDLRLIVTDEPGSLCTIAAAAIGSAVIGAGASAAAGASNAKAAKKASQAQQQSDAAAIAEQQRQFDINQSNLKPWLTTGQDALSQQRILLGLGGLPANANVMGATPSATSSQPNYAAYVQNNPDLLAAFQSQTGIARGKSMDQFGAEHWQGYGQGESRPYTPFGNTAAQGAATATPAAGAGPDAASQQQAAITALQSSPLYQSLYHNGEQAVLAAGAATGGLRGGNMQRSLANFGSDTLSAVIENQLNHLGGLSGQGASTGGALGQLGAGTSSNISSLLSQGGQAKAGGILAGAGFRNAGFQSGLSQALGGISTGLGLMQPYNTGLPQYSGAPAANDALNGLY